MGDIKEYRKKELKDFVFVNILMILYFSGMLQPFFESFSSHASSNGILFMAHYIFKNAFVAAVVYVYVFIFDSLLTGDAKFKVAYCNIEGMPGETVFTDLRSGKIKDNRFVVEELLSAYGDVFEKIDSDACKETQVKRKYENSFWYKIFSKYASTEQKLWVSQKDFLLCRDMTMACLYLLPVYLIGCVIITEMNFSMTIVMMLVIEAIFCDIAMRSKGRKFAVNVIATDLAKRANDY